LSIPTLANTDALTRDGVNEIVTSIDSKIAGRMFAPTSPSDKQVAKWSLSGSAWVAASVAPSELAQESATNGQLLTWNTGSSKWVPTTPVVAAAGGQQYAEVTSDVTITATTEATADTVVTAPSVTFNGTTKLEIEFFAPYITTYSGQTLTLVLYDGSSSIGKLGFFCNTAGYLTAGGVLKRVLTPSAASHTYSIRAYTDSGHGDIIGGSGGAGNVVPGFILMRYGS
jgi:hypothetical protein